jgi:hypothetical protein
VHKGHSLPIKHIRRVKDTERNQAWNRHSQTVKCIGRVKLGYQKKLSTPGALTDCQAHREGQVMTLKETGTLEALTDC